jgi:Asp-tRNA(Asn)/Glu-tRNA(Gln) amidotransferase A subunit family amidase
MLDRLDTAVEVLLALGEMGRGVSTVDFSDAMQVINGLSRAYLEFFTNYDVLLTLGEPSLTLGSFEPTREDPLQPLHRFARFSPFTPLINLTGQPAMSVPTFWNSSELPIGTHFVGRFGDEATLFRLAAQLEAVRDWNDKRPPKLPRTEG